MGYFIGELGIIPKKIKPWEPPMIGFFGPINTVDTRRLQITDSGSVVASTPDKNEVCELCDEKATDYHYVEGGQIKVCHRCYEALNC